MPVLSGQSTRLEESSEVGSDRVLQLNVGLASGVVGRSANHSVSTSASVGEDSGLPGCGLVKMKAKPL